MAERGQYRSIRITLFDGKDYRALPSDARWVFVLAKCNLGFSGIDVRYRDELTHRLAGQSGLPLARVADALAELEADAWILWHDNIIWVVGQLEHDPHLQPGDGKHRKGLLRHLSGLPRLPIVAQFIQNHPDWCKESELKKMGLSWALEGPSMGQVRAGEARNRNKEKEKGIGERKEDGGSALTVFHSDFASILPHFPPLDKAIEHPDWDMLTRLATRFNAFDEGKRLKLVGEIAGALEGMHGERRTMAELRTNIGDFLINPDAKPNMAALRGYLYRSPDTSARNGSKPTAGERAFRTADNALRDEP